MTSVHAPSRSTQTFAQEPAVAVALRDVLLQDEPAAGQEPCVGVGRGLRVRIGRRRRARVELRRVHADVADALLDAADHHPDRVAVDDAHERRVLRRPGRTFRGARNRAPAWRNRIPGEPADARGVAAPPPHAVAISATASANRRDGRRSSMRVHAPSVDVDGRRRTGSQHAGRPGPTARRASGRRWRATSSRQMTRKSVGSSIMR